MLLCMFINYVLWLPNSTDLIHTYLTQAQVWFVDI